MDIAKIISLSTESDGTPVAKIEIFKEGEPSVSEGGIGVPYGTLTASLEENIRPMPYYTKQISFKEMQNNVYTLTCRNLNLTDLSACKSCDPSGKLFPPTEFFESLDNALATITKVQGGVGGIRYTILSCPSSISREGEAVTFSNPNCRQITVATTHVNGNINRYSLISSPTKEIVQSAYLLSYGLRLVPANYNAVPWSSIPEYNSLLEQMTTEKIVCADNLDYTWLYNNIKKFLQEGYTFYSG